MTGRSTLLLPPFAPNMSTPTSYLCPGAMELGLPGPGPRTLMWSGSLCRNLCSFLYPGAHRGNSHWLAFLQDWQKRSHGLELPYCPYACNESKLDSRGGRVYSARDVSAKLSSCCFLSSRLVMWQPQLSINLQQQGLLNLRQWVSWLADASSRHWKILSELTPVP